MIIFNSRGFLAENKAYVGNTIFIFWILKINFLKEMQNSGEFPLFLKISVIKLFVFAYRLSKDFCWMEVSIKMGKAPFHVFILFTN